MFKMKSTAWLGHTYGSCWAVVGFRWLQDGDSGLLIAEDLAVLRVKWQKLDQLTVHKERNVTGAYAECQFVPLSKVRKWAIGQRDWTIETTLVKCNIEPALAHV